VAESWIAFFRFRFSLFRKRTISFLHYEYLAIEKNFLIRLGRSKWRKPLFSKSAIVGSESFQKLFSDADYLLMQGEYFEALDVGTKAESLRQELKRIEFPESLINDWAGGDWVSNIGHTALGLQLLRMKKMVEEVETPVLFHSYGSTNKLLLEKISNHVNIKSLPLLRYYRFEEMFRAFRIEMNYINTQVGVLEINEAFKYYCYLTRSKIEPISLTPEELEISFDYLKKSKIDIDAPMIALHVRETHERDKLRSGNYSDLESIVQACLPFAEQGFQFIRMGNTGMRRLSSLESLSNSPLNSRFFDYANSEIKSELMDVFFWSNCKFLIGGDSGPITVPMLFNKPVLRLNANQPFLANIGYSGYIVPKLIRNVESGNLLSYIENIELPVLWSHKNEIEPLRRECLPSSVIQACIDDMINICLQKREGESKARDLLDFPYTKRHQRHYPVHELPLSPSFVSRYGELLNY